MIKNFTFISFSIFSILLLGNAQAQDSIILNNGREIQGVIVFDSSDRVRIQTSTGEFSIPRDTIEKIKRGSVSENHLIVLENALKLGDFSEAYEAHQYAISEDDLSTDSLKVYWLTYFENLIRVTPSRPIAVRGEINRKLLDLSKAYHDSDKFLYQSSRLFFALGNLTSSYESLSIVSNSAIVGNVEFSISAKSFFPRLTENLHRQGLYEEAIQVIERLVEVDPEYGSAQKTLFSLYASSVARKNEDYERALEIIRNDLYPTSPNLALNRITIVLDSLKLFAQSEKTEAKARTLVEQYVTGIDRKIADQAFHDLLVLEMERQIREQDYDSAYQLGEKYLNRDQDGSIDSLYSTARHYARYQVVDRENPLDLLELAIQAHDQKLHQEALELLYQVRENTEIKELAEQQIDIIKREQDLDVLGRAIDAFDEGDMDLVIKVCNELDLDDGRMSPQIDEIRQLSNTARREIDLRAKARPYQAEAYYQEAERSFFLGETNIAWRYVQTILRDYSDTPAAIRATHLLDDLQTDKQIDALEKSRYNPVSDQYAESSTKDSENIFGDSENEEDTNDPLKQEIAALLHMIDQKQP